ncbi:hypothetical protein [Myxococcus sp. CA040A]|uniref:hypothetical protein n=1 Tax=Myxococcus sp. CA040A TaxID=2741738 RepID=UPI00157B2310|nr:hypothetical protein [Myxococcus sp. CA040A]NTX04476.1 hypothetical protein [Myxococcus sp. CA040A]
MTCAGASFGTGRSGLSFDEDFLAEGAFFGGATFLGALSFFDVEVFIAAFRGEDFFAVAIGWVLP